MTDVQKDKNQKKPEDPKTQKKDEKAKAEEELVSDECCSDDFVIE